MLIGHREQANFLEKSFRNGKMVHAYLFLGPAGVGKRTVAKELVSKIFDSKVVENDWKIREVSRINDAKTGKKHKDISIEQIKEVGDYLNHHSLVSGYQVVIIDEADFLSRGASNALLKTLEEPRARKALIILLAENEENLLPTIISRCQLIRFFPVPTQEIVEALKKQGASQIEAEQIASFSNHCPGKALNLWQDPEDKVFFQKETTRFFKLLKGGLAERLESLSDLFGGKADHIEARGHLIKILDLWQLLWRDIYLTQIGLNKQLSQKSEIEKIQPQAQRYSLKSITSVLGEIEEAEILLKQNVHPRLIMENLILSFY